MEAVKEKKRTNYEWKRKKIIKEKVRDMAKQHVCDDVDDDEEKMVENKVQKKKNGRNKEKGRNKRNGKKYSRRLINCISQKKKIEE